MAKTPVAKLVARGESIEIRQTTRKNMKWPGYADCAALGRIGYWVGNFERQQFADPRFTLDDLCRRFGCTPVTEEE